MSTETPTPRTDALSARKGAWANHHIVELVILSETLERELTAALADAEEERYETNRTASALQATEGLLKQVRAELAALKAAPTPLDRPDVPGDYWQWNELTKQWIMCHVTNLEYWGTGIWLRATPPAEPVREGGE